ncbi:MAG: hypothetical protein KC457_00250 [Myxococcales bacterium]|nr:hypothetical protein [Myxococcales bacterium]
MISTWHGEGTAEVIDRYFNWTDAHAAAALAAEERLVHIIDLGNCVVPPAHIRRRVYEHAQADLIREVTMCSIVAVDDPKLRQIVVTAHMPQPGMRPTELIFVETIEQAIVEAQGRLWAARIPLPSNLDPRRYQPPVPVS